MQNTYNENTKNPYPVPGDVDALAGFKGVKITLRNDAGTWYYTDHSKEAPAEVAVGSTIFTPSFYVRGVNLQYSAGGGVGTFARAQVGHDATFSGVVEELATGVVHSIFGVSQINLANCLADKIFLHV
jgi:hypothetical protein